jgi:Transposase DDE domain group 1
MGRAMIDLHRGSFRQAPKRIVLGIHDTFDAVHGGEQLRLFNAHNDEYGFQEFLHGAKSWSRVERIIARVEVGAEGPDTRFIVTNPTTRNARVLNEDVYCQRGQAENHIVVENASGRRPHLPRQGHRQPVPTVPPRLRFLASLGSALFKAAALDVACRAIRHLAPAAPALLQAYLTALS